MRLPMLLLMGTMAAVGCKDGNPLVEHYAPSTLDGAEKSPRSWHHAHVRVDGADEYTLDNGAVIYIGTAAAPAPDIAIGAIGELYVSVPIYGADNNNYYFEKFVPDVPAPTK